MLSQLPGLWFGRTWFCFPSGSLEIRISGQTKPSYEQTELPDKCVVLVRKPNQWFIPSNLTIQ